jgi:hypothetical protein
MGLNRLFAQIQAGVHKTAAGYPQKSVKTNGGSN